MMTLLYSILVLGIFGFVFGALLSLAANYFKIDTNKTIEDILAILPGVNCGTCGCASCQDFAEKVCRGEKPQTGCRPGGKKVAEKLKEILG